MTWELKVFLLCRDGARRVTGRWRKPATDAGPLQNRETTDAGAWNALPPSGRDGSRPPDADERSRSVGEAAACGDHDRVLKLMGF